MGHFSDFLAIFQYNFGDSWDNHGMWPIILGYFFSNNYNGNKYISFQDLHDPRGVIFQNFRLIFRTYERGVVDMDITMACDISI